MAGGLGTCATLSPEWSWRAINGYGVKKPPQSEMAQEQAYRSTKLKLP